MKLLYLCMDGCGQIKPEDMIYMKESNTLECKCGCDVWYLCPDKEAE